MVSDFVFSNSIKSKKNVIGFASFLISVDALIQITKQVFFDTEVASSINIDI